jgi:hypothetical protein
VTQALLKIGFTLKSRQVMYKTSKDGEQVNSEPVQEYTHIIMPGDLPVKYILKTILATVQPSVATPGRAMSNVDDAGSESPLPPMPSSPLPTNSLASSRSFDMAPSTNDHRSSPTMLAIGSLSSARSSSAIPVRTSLASEASSSPLSSSKSGTLPPVSPRQASSLSSASSWASTIPSSPSAGTFLSTRSQPLPVTRSAEPFMAEAYTPGALSSEFAALLQGLDEVANLGGGVASAGSRETCGLCKQSFPAEVTKRIAAKSFCAPCHQRVLDLAKQRAVKLG